MTDRDACRTPRAPAGRPAVTAAALRGRATWTRLAPRVSAAISAARRASRVAGARRRPGPAASRSSSSRLVRGRRCTTGAAALLTDDEQRRCAVWAGRDVEPGSRSPTIGDRSERPVEHLDLVGVRGTLGLERQHHPERIRDLVPQPDARHPGQVGACVDDGGQEPDHVRHRHLHEILSRHGRDTAPAVPRVRTRDEHGRAAVVHVEGDRVDPLVGMCTPPKVAVVRSQPDIPQHDRAGDRTRSRTVDGASIEPARAGRPRRVGPAVTADGLVAWATPPAADVSACGPALVTDAGRGLGRRCS